MRDEAGTPSSYPSQPLLSGVHCRDHVACRVLPGACWWLRRGTHVQTDKKTLNTKGMVQEMKDIREKRRSAEATAKAVSVQTPFVFPLNPDLTFNCQDK